MQVAVAISLPGELTAPRCPAWNRSGSALAAVIGDEKAEARHFRYKPLLAEGEERCLALNDLDVMVAVLKTTT